MRANCFSRRCLRHEAAAPAVFARRPARLPVVLCLAVLSGCAPSRGPSWSQFHAGGPSHGSLLRPTEPAIRPAWEFQVGPTEYGKPQSSPVIGPDGAVYIGNIGGDIVAVNPDGTERWRATTPFRIFSTPAVADDGTVYAVGTSFFPDAKFPDNSFRSTLITIASNGTVLDLSLLPDQGFTAGSPKVWSSGRENYVFLHANMRVRVLNSRANALLVFDRDGDLLAREDLGCSLPVTGGPSILDLLKSLFPQFDPTGSLLDDDDYGWIDPSVAVAERDDIAEPGNAVVVAADAACSNLVAYRWAAPKLERLWFVSEGDDTIASSSPAILNGGALVAIARADGKVFAYDLADGNKLWTFDTGEFALGTPASLARHVYVTSRTTVRALEPATGELFRERELVATTVASPVVSASHVYVVQWQGLQTFDLELDPVLHDFQAGAFGFAGSPAIAADGTLYTVAKRSGNTFLLAYPAS